ncbi:MAG: chemotaxis protein CheC, partial [Spongiibacteraceae bacterium]|nr:chemotaxis protein CheC [Spongiibacteraceae bacterium]
MQLSEMEQDAISEMLNLGIGSAVTAMSTMVQNQVTISIPRLNFVKNKDYKIIDAISDNSCIIVSVNVQRELQGQLSLIIPESDTAKTARAIIQMQMDDKTLSGIENDVIAEMGNIVLH